MRRRFVFWGALCPVLASALVGCGGSSAKPPEAPLISVEQEQRNAESSAPSLPEVPTTLQRADVEQVVDAGLGRFLQTVSVEAVVTGGRFQGFRIAAIRPPDAWHGVDLRVGDVVTAINGKTIERPEQAHEAFVALKQENALVVSYTRTGQRRELTLPIVGAPAAPSGAGEKAPPASPKATEAKP